MSKTTAKFSRETLERIKDHGKMGDSFEDVVNRLLDETEEFDENEEGEEDEA